MFCAQCCGIKGSGAEHRKPILHPRIRPDNEKQRQSQKDKQGLPGTSPMPAQLQEPARAEQPGRESC